MISGEARVYDSQNQIDFSDRRLILQTRYACLAITTVMNLDKFLNILSATLGLFGALLLAKGIIKLTPDIIVNQITTYMEYNTHQLSSIAEQKADVISGVSLVALAFLFQIIALVFISRDIMIFKSYWGGASLSIAMAFLLLAIAFFVDLPLKKHFELDAKKTLATNQLQFYLKGKVLTNGNYRDIKYDAEKLLDFKQKDNESPRDFIIRYSNYLGISASNDIDWSAIDQKIHNKSVPLDD